MGNTNIVTFAPAFFEQIEREANKAHEKFTLDLLEALRVDWDGDDEAEVPDIVQDLVADEEVTLLGGHGGVGKSFLALQMACAVATANPVLGKSTDLLRTQQPKRVLYYSAEDGRKRLIRRMHRIIENFGDYNTGQLRENLLIVDASELEPLFGELESKHRAFSKPIGAKADFLRLQQVVKIFDPQLVVIDGASDTFDGNEIARRDVRAFIKLLRRIHPHRNIGILLTVHIDRSSARGYSSNDDGYAGSAQWHNSCRRRMYLQLKKDEDGVESMVLRVMKNQDGVPIPDIELERGEHGLWFVSGTTPEVGFGGQLAPEKVDHSETLLTLIDAYYQREQWISTSLASNSSTGVFATLSSDPEFPRALNKQKTDKLLRQLIREGKLTEEKYRRSQGGQATRWKVSRKAVDES